MGVVALLFFSAVLAGGAPEAGARDFTIVAWGGNSQAVRSDCYFKPFAQSKGIPILEDVYLGGWGVFQAMKDTGQVPWDVVQVESSELMRGCEEGVFIPIDWSRVADPAEFIPEAVSECGVGLSVWSLCVSFNPQKVGKLPTKLADFWDLNTWPGKRGMRQGPKVNLEIALMADGVPPERVYQTLATPEGVDRAFKKLDQIKPVLQLWKASAQVMERLLSGDLMMSMCYNSRIMTAREEGLNLDLIWDGAVYAVDSWAIPTGSPHIDLAYDFLKFFVNSERHYEALTRWKSTSPILRVNEMMNAEMLKVRPIGDNLKTALFMGTDEGLAFWLDNQDGLTQRWNAWLGND
jgi:putative spermidine/putrescine transport system substrate-binding protein